MAASVEKSEFVDHYVVLGLPSGEEGCKISLKQIEKAYRTQSRSRHPDKRPNDPNATADFQRLTFSFEVLRVEATRRAFDAVLRSRHERAARSSLHDAKRRKLATDLEERERAAASPASHPSVSAAKKEKSVAEELQRELADFKARNAKKSTSNLSSSMPRKETAEEDGVFLDRGKMLKVSWDRQGGDYDAVRLRDLFERFGTVDDIVIKSKASKKRGSAIVVMSTNEAAAEALKSTSGPISNPLLVLPLEMSTSSTSSPFCASFSEPISRSVRFQDYESSIMKKLEKAKEKRTTS